MSPLTQMQLRILRFLNTHDGWVTRKDMGEITGDKRGFSEALGAPTNPPIRVDSLEGRGLVERQDMTQPFHYRITQAGRLATSTLQS